jgi:thiol peroxidase
MSTTITLKGNEVHTIGTLPSVGSTVKDFALVDSGLNVKLLKLLKEKRKYSIFSQVLIRLPVPLPAENLMKKLQN